MRSATLLACVVLVVASGPATAGAAAPAPGSTAGVPAASQSGSGCSFPASATDATGREVTVSEEPERVVVLAPSTAQIMWEVGAESKVVGMPVGPYTDYLAGSSERTDVWNPDGTVNQEQVVALRPDVVVTADITPNGTVSDLRSAGLTVYKTPLDRSLTSITGKVGTFGRLVGACAGARATNEEFNRSLAEIRETAPDRSPRVLYYFYEFTAGSGTFVHEAIETAGGDNVAARAGIDGFARVNDETVAARDPVWIVTPEGATIPDREPFTGTTAVELNQTLTVDDNYISQPAPRVVIPMRTMADAFAHTRTSTDPDGDGLYEDVNGDGEVRPGDATVLFNAIFLGEPGFVDNPTLYDFNGDGELRPGDATVLFKESL